MRYHHSPWQQLLLLALLSWVFPSLAETPVPVTVSELGSLIVHPLDVAPASVVSINDSQLSSELDATIEDIVVQVGDPVSKGSVLLKLESIGFQLALEGEKAGVEALKARLRLSEAQLGRARKLEKQRSASQELLNQRESEVAVLKAQISEKRAMVAEAERMVAKCVIRAPFSGTVVERIGMLGQLARPGTPLIRLVDLEDIDVVANIQTNQLESLKSAKRLSFRSGDRSFILRLGQVVPILDTKARSQQVRLRFVHERALPGEAGTLEWRQSQSFIPPNLIVQRNGDLGIFKLENQQAVFVPLPNAEEGRPAPINLPNSDLIIVDGRFAVKDGTSVTVR